MNRPWRGALAAVAMQIAAAAFASAGDDAEHPPARIHPTPDVYLFYQLELSRSEVGLLHETRWTDAVAAELRQLLDTDGDGDLSGAEIETFGRAWAERLRRSFRFEINGTPAVLGEAVISHHIHVPSQADLDRALALQEYDEDDADGDPQQPDPSISASLYRGISWEFTLFIDWTVPLPAETPIELALIETIYQDDEDPAGIPPETVLPELDAPWTANALLVFQKDGEEGLSILYGTDPDDPLYVTPEIRIEFDWSGVGPTSFEFEEFIDPNREVAEKMLGFLADASVGTWSFAFFVFLIFAFGYGATHALMPGHGKAMVAAYLVGTRGRWIDAVYLGAIVTVTHTAAVIVLAILTFAVLQSDSKGVQQWVAIASGAGIVLIGLWLLTRQLRALATGKPMPHGHSHEHGHSHGHEHAHEHAPAHEKGERTGFGELFALGVTGGMLPCPGALITFLGALHLGMHFRGLLIVFAFSLGLAMVLIAIGLVVVSSSRVLDRFGGDRVGRALLVMPVVSAFLVTLVGVYVTLTAMQAGPMKLL